MTNVCLTEIGAPPIGGAQLSSRGARAPPGAATATYRAYEICNKTRKFNQVIFLHQRRTILFDYKHGECSRRRRNFWESWGNLNFHLFERAFKILCNKTWEIT